jgi:hypothetical protein
MRTWMRRGIPAALLAGGVLAMTAGNAAAALGDPTGVADTALRLTDIVGHKGLPPLPDTSQIQLPAMPIGQSQRSLDPSDLGGGSLSLSNVQLNGTDLPKPALPGLPALPSLGGDDQRSIDPSHIAISDLPQLQQLPKVPSVGSGLPIALLPNLGTERSLPNFSYSGAVPTGGLHSLTKVPDLSNVSELTQLSDPAQLPSVPELPLGDDQRSLPAVPALPKLPLNLPGVPAGRSLPGLALPQLPLAGLLPVGAQRSLPGLPQLPLAGLLPVPASRSLPGLDLLNTLPLQGLLGVAGSERELPGLNLLSALPLQGLLGVAGTERDLPGLPQLPLAGLLPVPAGRSLPGLALPQLPLNGLLPLGGQQRSLPGLDLLNTLPLQGLLGVAGTERDLPGLPALPLAGLLPVPAGRALPALPGLNVVQGLLANTPLAALLASTPLGSVAGRDLPALPGLSSLPLGLLTGLSGADERSLPGLDLLNTLPLQGLLGVAGTERDLPAVPALPKLPLNVLPTQERDLPQLPLVGSALSKLPALGNGLPGASVNGIHGVPELGPEFAPAMPTDDSARSLVPGLPSTPAVLGGLLGHAPRLPISGI